MSGHSSLRPTAAHLSPSAAVLLFTLGILLIYLELNRPGRVIPGALGLLATLFAVAAFLLHAPVSTPGLVLVAVGFALLGLDVLVPYAGIVALLATATLVGGFTFLVFAPPLLAAPRVIATLCGGVLGVGTSVLTRLARRARTNKRVNKAVD